MKSEIVILGAVLSYLTRVTADANCFGVDEKAHPIQWKDIGGDVIRQRFGSRVCSVISIHDDHWHEEGQNSKIKECLTYGENRAELELTSLEGPRIRYENCKQLVDKATEQCAFGGDMELTAGPDAAQETVKAKLLLNLLRGSC